jgi:hypothetical protein
MPHAALTAAAPADPAACLPPPPSTAKPRANPNRGLDRRTTHGNHGAHPRARNRFRRTLLRISRAEITRDRDQAHLRPGFAARLCGYPRVLMPPPRPRGGITEAEDHAMCHAVTASLAPRAAVAEARRGAYTNASSGPPARPPVPIAPYSGDSHPERELAAHAAGLRAPANRPPRGAPTPGPTAPFKPSRTDPLNREPTAKPGSTVPFKPFRTDPLNREPTTKTGATAPPVAGSNASSAAVTAQPARAHGPAPRPEQSGEGSKVRAQP